jgi:hypothetical protein
MKRKKMVTTYIFYLKLFTSISFIPEQTNIALPAAPFPRLHGCNHT